ncbi:hypothetical protein NP493_129g02033 [Ridgeia piscesae]|uniref:Uncharacterized protein n=1 Tax=Ridgeia piscesae TaxID=27915 RepID=A0AAD9P5P4_RIDPI|nr:hypothetical protein NP493_129g02033 [Ridgeia piscesae]
MPTCYIYITQTCYIEHSATLKLICENTNCTKETYSPLSLASTLH